MILLEIPGKPVTNMHHKGYGRRAYDPRGPDKKIIRTIMKRQYKDEVITGPVIVEMTFYLSYAKSTTKIKKRAMLDGEIRHTVKPDTSNLYYLYENCLKELIIHDDAQVVKFTAAKLWCEPGKEKTIIKIYPCEETVIMPLKKSKAKSDIEKNNKTEVRAKKPVKQAAAIAYSEARKSNSSLPKKKASRKKDKE
jgi:Holliday junction resolvase RusA-like endonuclease